ncbi:MAG: hypothetical protein ACYDAR_22220, partial [Thermomicrobiales bacterium]
SGRFDAYYHGDIASVVFQPELESAGWFADRPYFPPRPVIDAAIAQQGRMIDLRPFFQYTAEERQEFWVFNWSEKRTHMTVTPQVWGIPGGTRVRFRLPATHLTIGERWFGKRRAEATGVEREFTALFDALSRTLPAEREIWFQSETEYPLCSDPNVMGKVGYYLKHEYGGMHDAWFTRGSWQITPVPGAERIPAWIAEREATHRDERERLERSIPVRRRIEHNEYLYDLPVQDMVAGGGRDGHAVTRMERVPAPARPIADIQKEVGSRLVSYPILVCRVRLVGEAEMEEHEVRVVPEQISPDPARVRRIREASRRRLEAMIRAGDPDEDEEGECGGERGEPEGATTGTTPAFRDEPASDATNVPRRTKRRRWVTPPPESP